MVYKEAFKLVGIQDFCDRMNIALFAFNVQTKSVHVSQAVQEIYGCSPENFKEDPLLWTRLIHPEDKDWVSEFTTHWIPGKIKEREYRICRPDGEIRWVKTRSTGVFDECGNLVFIEGILHDITDAKFLEEKVWENEKRYRAVVENSPQPIVVVQNERFVYANWATVKALGMKSQEEIVNRFIYDLVYPNDHERARERMNRPFDDQDIQSSELRLNLLDGRSIIGELLSVPILYMGKPSYLVMGNDISERKQMEEELAQSEARYKNLVEGALVGVYLFQRNQIMYINPYIQKLLGYSLKDLNSKPIADFVVEEDRAKFIRSIERLGTELNELTEQYQVIKKDGEIADVQIQAAVTVYNGAPALIGTVQDVTDQVKVNKRVREMAYTDALTGLLNRYALKTFLDESIAFDTAKSTELGILFMDLDRFKFINDTLGHAAGDFILKEVAHRLKQCVRKEDRVARYGGDEFIIVLQDANLEGIKQAAGRIVNCLNQPYLYENEELYTSPSIGISIYPYDGGSAQALIKNADTAMYIAKGKGKNNYQFFTSEISEQYSHQLKLEKGLRKAIQNGELVLYFQPQVNLQTGEVIGFESLLRWIHPEFGMIPPSEFIPIAEEIGQIIPIGKWVLKTACQQNKLWQDKGYPRVPMAVNISGHQFLQDDFVEVVKEILDETQLDPTYLELEMTESTLKNTKILTPLLAELQAMGVRTSIDDFGTGYSSLSLIKNLPIDVIKIDRSFVVDMVKDNTSSILVKAIIEMGSGLNFQIIAEGIETEEEAEFLKQTKCQAGQGYLFARPLPAKEIELLFCGR